MDRDGRRGSPKLDIGSEPDRKISMDRRPHTGRVLIGLGVLAAAISGVVGWFVGESLGGHGEAGVAVVYGVGVLLWALLDEHTGETTFMAILAFVVGLPIVYAVPPPAWPPEKPHDQGCFLPLMRPHR